MPKRYAIFLVSAVLLSVALTVAAFVVHNAFKFDPFAEVMVINNSGETISSVEIKQGRLTMTMQNIPSGTEFPLCFYAQSSGYDDHYSVTVRFLDGRILQESANVIRNCAKHEINVSKDSLNTGYRRSTAL